MGQLLIRTDLSLALARGNAHFIHFLDYFFLLGKSTQLKAYFYVWPDCWFDSSKESNLVFTVPKFLPFFCFIRFRMTHFKFSPIGRTNFKIENIHNYCMLCSRYNDMSPTNCNVCIAQCNPRYQNKTLRSILLLWY